MKSLRAAIFVCALRLQQRYALQVSAQRKSEAGVATLGHQRLRLLSCLNGMRSSSEFAPRSGEDVFGSFREWIAELVREHGAVAGPAPDVTLALLGAGRLLSGDLSGADVIVENLPVQPYELDHGAGYCLVQPLQALSTALPLPAHLRDTSRWLAGSEEQAALRAWLSQHRAELVWDEPRGVYGLGSQPSAENERMREAIARLSRLERLDLNPPLPHLREAQDEDAVAHELLVQAGAGSVPLIEAALDGASGTGRVALMRVLLELDAERAGAVLQRLLDDDTPAWVDTCLVGHRRVKDWARNVAPRPPPNGREPNDLRRRRELLRARFSLRHWALVLAILAAVWAYLNW